MRAHGMIERLVSLVRWMWRRSRSAWSVTRLSGHRHTLSMILRLSVNDMPKRSTLLGSASPKIDILGFLPVFSQRQLVSEGLLHAILSEGRVQRTKLARLVLTFHAKMDLNDDVSGRVWSSG
jgi:hypothetical protein